MSLRDVSPHAIYTPKRHEALRFYYNHSGEAAKGALNGAVIAQLAHMGLLRRTDSSSVWPATGKTFSTTPYVLSVSGVRMLDQLDRLYPITPTEEAPDGDR